MALLDAGERSYIDPGPLAHLALAEVVLESHATDLRAHSAAAGDDPVVGWGGTWHLSTPPTP